jgi:uncharacterized protein (TIGR03435 family)
MSATGVRRPSGCGNLKEISFFVSPLQGHERKSILISRWRMKAKTLKHLLFVCAVASFCPAQQLPGAETPKFDVASVKPATTREMGGVYTYPGGRVAFRGCTLLYLMQQAFDLQAFQVTGGPEWMQDERYDIDAKVPITSESSHSMPPYSKAALNSEQRQMLQALLAERFNMKYRRETREGPVYLLVKGKGPLRMTGSKDESAYPWSGGLRGGMIVGDGMAGINESMEDLARRLSRYLGRPVLNRTELPGSFDFRTEYSPEDSGPDVTNMILACVQDIGLKLEPSKGPVETIMIDRATKPSPN